MDVKGDKAVGMHNPELMQTPRDRLYAQLYVNNFEILDDTHSLPDAAPSRVSRDVTDNNCKRNTSGFVPQLPTPQEILTTMKSSQIALGSDPLEVIARKPAVTGRELATVAHHSVHASTRSRQQYESHWTIAQQLEEPRLVVGSSASAHQPTSGAASTNSIGEVGGETATMIVTDSLSPKQRKALDHKSHWQLS
jgi:hypothetical protein